jgi:membrane-bound ClpP family serine protease
MTTNASSNTNANIKYGIVIGTAIFGLATLLTTYDSITKINEGYLECEENNPDLQRAQQNKFITVLTIAIVAVVMGIIIKYLLNKNIIAMGFITAGVLGITYAIALKLQYLSSTVKVSVSWVTFIILIIAGVLYDRGYPSTTITSGTNVIETIT